MNIKLGTYIQNIRHELGTEFMDEHESKYGLDGVIEYCLTYRMSRILSEAYDKIVTEFKENGVSESQYYQTISSYCEQVDDLNDEFSDWS